MDIDRRTKSFFDFVRERHLIWHRRLVERRPRPWTTDPVLDRFQFTNVYRELDRGTIWYKENMAAGCPPGPELLWRTIAYRLLNRAETFERARLPAAGRWGKGRAAFAAALKKIKRAGRPVFTGAHQVPFAGVDEYIETLDAANAGLAGLTAALRAAAGLREVVGHLRSIPRVGPFLANQVALDLVMVGALPLAEDWVAEGPGSGRGMDLLFPDRTKKEFVALAAFLRDRAESYFAATRPPFPYPIVDGRKLRLGLFAIEHSLCEFYKWYRATTGGARPRRVFRAHGKTK